MDGIYRQEAPAEEQPDGEEDRSMGELAVRSQPSVESNSAMNSAQSNSANKEGEYEGGKTPKANLRQERITSTRPQLVFQGT
jgi:hypothetical protein